MQICFKKKRFPKAAPAFKRVNDPHGGKGSPLDASSPNHGQWPCLWPGQYCAGREQEQSCDSRAADQGSVVNHQL